MEAARVGARVNVEGVRSVVSEMNTWLRVLRDVRKELQGINSEAAKFPASVGAPGGGGGGGSAPGVPSPSNLSSFSKMQSMQRGFAGAGTYLGVRAAGQLLDYGTGRFNRNMAESTPISQNDILLTSMYSGYKYGVVDRQRLSQLGKFGMSRGEAAAAQGIALGYGQSASQANSYLSNTVAPLVQASGGTLTPSAAAGQAASFLDPLTLRRARSFGITPGKVNGQVGNPLTVAQGYIKEFERRFGVKLNSIDFENMRSPGSIQRSNFKRLYQLTDDSIDVIVQSGLQNAKFQSISGGKAINFSSSKDLSAIGATTGRLGLKSFEYLSASAGREARFFQKQEGAQVGKLQQDINIENTLADVEDAFSGLIGPMGEFQKYLKLGVAGLQALAGVSLLRGLAGGGGGGGVGGGGGIGGLGGGGLGGLGGGGGGGALGMIAGAAALGGVGMMTASYGGSHGGIGGAAVGIGGTAAAWGAAGTMIAPGVGTAVGAVAGAAYGAVKYFDGKHQREVAGARADYATMTEEQLFALGMRSAGVNGFGGGAGPKETARFDIIQQRRGAMLAAMLDEMNSGNMFQHANGSDAAAISKLIQFGQSKDVTKDVAFAAAHATYNVSAAKFVRNPDAMAIYRKYFGNLKDPWDMHPASTDVARGLVSTAQDIIGNSHVGDPISGKGASGATWDNLDASFKTPLSNLLKAAGGKVWLGNGWRSSKQQSDLFFGRHHEDPNGDIEYNGKRYSLNPGASPAAPPNRSMHEIGRAADLEGDLAWVQQNASKFGLKTFAGVNGEPWHVQLSSDPNSRSDYEKGGVQAAENYANSSSTSGGGGGGGGSYAGLAADSGINFSYANTKPSSAVGGTWAGTASSSTSGALSGSGSGSAGSLSAQDVARMAYKAGFRGSDLVNIVAIAGRESSYKATAYNGNTKTGDQSYGLTQINMLGSLGPSRLRQFGISDASQLFDPQTNLNAAFSLYSAAGNSLSAWGGYKGQSNTANTNIGAAQAAVSAAGIGDPYRGGGGSSYNPVFHIAVSLVASGDLGYDAGMLADELGTKIKEKDAMYARRGS